MDRKTDLGAEQLMRSVHAARDAQTGEKTHSEETLQMTGRWRISFS